VPQQFAELDNEFGASIRRPGYPTVARPRPEGAGLTSRPTAITAPSCGAQVRPTSSSCTRPAAAPRRGMRFASPSTAPAAAIDLPGHGRSNCRSDGRHEPRQVAAVTAVTVLSSAPRAHPVVGTGLSGLVAPAFSTTPRPALPVGSRAGRRPSGRWANVTAGRRHPTGLPRRRRGRFG
jgi:hypothetical protein